MSSFKNLHFDWNFFVRLTEEHEESVYNLFISEVRNFRMRVEAHEEQLIRQIRSPLERDEPKAIMQRIIDQEVRFHNRPGFSRTTIQLNY